MTNYPIKPDGQAQKQQEEDIQSRELSQYRRKTPTPLTGFERPITSRNLLSIRVLRKPTVQDRQLDLNRLREVALP
jgi:hypothetical protein